jgi:hypothetical protein
MAAATRRTHAALARVLVDALGSATTGAADAIRTEIVHVAPGEKGATTAMSSPEEAPSCANRIASGKASGQRAASSGRA